MQCHKTRRDANLSNSSALNPKLPESDDVIYIDPNG